MFDRRIVIFSGHFGSGKTELALNLALSEARAKRPVTLVDLDVVKPYFRSRSGREFLAEAGVTFVAPQGDLLQADLPVILPAVRSLCRTQSERVVMDVGGDDTGARVVGSLQDVLDPSQTEFLLVLNFRRPFTPDPESAVTMARDIERSARLRFTGIVSNTHLMAETTLAVIREGFDMAVRTGELLDLPVKAVGIEAAFEPQPDAHTFPCPILGIERILTPPFQSQTGQVRQTGPLFVLT